MAKGRSGTANKGPSDQLKSSHNRTIINIMLNSISL